MISLTRKKISISLKYIETFVYRVRTILFSNLTSRTFHFPVIFNSPVEEESSLKKKYQTSAHSIRITVETKIFFGTRILLFVRVKTPKEIGKLYLMAKEEGKKEGRTWSKNGKGKNKERNCFSTRESDRIKRGMV